MMKCEGLGRGFWVGMVAVFLWCLWRILSSEAWPLDDELSHFQFSQEAWTHPSELLNMWTRPGRNIFHAPVAILGFEITRVWTLLWAMFAIWLTASEAKRMRIAGVCFLPLLIGFQCWFPELAGNVLTQTPFMLAWIAGVWLAARGRLRAAAVCFSLLGLIRHEGVAISALWGLWVISAPGGLLREVFMRNWQNALRALWKATELGLWTLVPHFILNTATYLVDGSLPFLIYFDEKPTEMYGSGTIWHFVPLIIAGAGFPALFLGLLGIRRIEDKDWIRVLYWTYPAYFLLHSLIYWRGMFASGGYYHFLMPMAPWLGIMALAGLSRITKPALKYVALGLVIFLGILMPQEQTSSIYTANKATNWWDMVKHFRFPAPPLELTTFQKGLREGAHWLDDHLEEDGTWLCCHVASPHFRRNDKGSRIKSYDFADAEGKAKIPAGALFMWEEKYAPDENFNWTKEELDTNWEKLAEWADGSVVMYRKRTQSL